MVLIAPSILSADFNKLGEEINSVINGGADWIHYDVMDGSFVPNISMGLPVLKSIRKNAALFIDVHLMIEHPSKYIESFLSHGADMLTLHVESDTPDNLHESFAKIHAAGKKAGISLKPATPVESLQPFLNEVDMVLVMSVEPGFGGQAFMYEQLDKVRYLRTVIDDPNFIIQLDGGITPVTASASIKAGVNCLVSGSNVFHASDRAAAISSLRNSYFPEE